MSWYDAGRDGSHASTRNTEDCWHHKKLRKRYGKDSPLKPTGGSMTLLTAWLETSNLQNHERIPFCCFKSSLWHFLCQGSLRKKTQVGTALRSYTLGREGGREDWAVVKVAQPWGSSGVGKTLQKHPKWRQRAFGPPASICRWIEAAPWEGWKLGWGSFLQIFAPTPQANIGLYPKVRGKCSLPLQWPFPQEMEKFFPTVSWDQLSWDSVFPPCQTYLLPADKRYVEFNVL